MPSLRSRLFLAVLRNRHLLQFRWKRETSVDWETSIFEQRIKAGKTSKLFGKLPAEITSTSCTIGDLRTEWIKPLQGTNARVILYFHGGGYVMGSIEGHRTHVAKVVIGSGIGALLFDYRLAPENPYPAALEDSLAAYRYLLAEGVSPSKIVFVGDSAGGGLCLATLVTLKEKGLPLPAAAVAFSPWTDLKCTGDSYKSKLEVEPLAPTDSWTVYSKYYVGEHDPCLPGISPLYGDLHDLPPIMIFVGTNEVLLDDSVQFAKKAAEVGVDVTLRIGEGMFHCYPLCAPLFPEAKQALMEACSFIAENISSV